MFVLELNLNPVLFHQEKLWVGAITVRIKNCLEFKIYIKGGEDM